MIKQIVGLVSILLLFIGPAGWADTSNADLRLLVLSEFEERIAGKMAFYSIEQNLREQGHAIVSDPRVTAIGRKLARYSDRMHQRYSFYVIQGELAPQALSLPGGYVFISQSMLDTVCRTDDSIAFILGHEIAHSALRHYADYRLQDRQQAAHVKKLLQQENSFADDEYKDESDLLHGILLPYLVNVRQLKEIEADQFGALYALRAGYRYSAAIRSLERLRALFGDDYRLEKELFVPASELPSSQTTHPGLSKRIEQLKLFRLKAIEIGKLFPTGRTALDNGSYQEAALVFESIISLFPQSRTARIGLGVAYHLQFWDSSPGDDFLLAYPGSLELEHLQLLRGRPDYQTLEQAVEEYRQVQAFEPGNKYAANNLGVALAELQRLDEAETVLREALRVDVQDFVLFNLALVLHRQYKNTQQSKLQNEVIDLLKRYLVLAPSDEVAQQYLQELVQKKSP